MGKKPALMVAKNAAVDMLRLPVEQLAQVRTSAAEPTPHHKPTAHHKPTPHHGLEDLGTYRNSWAAHPWGMLTGPNQLA